MAVQADDTPSMGLRLAFLLTVLFVASWGAALADGTLFSAPQLSYALVYQLPAKKKKNYREIVMFVHSYMVKCAQS